MKNANKTLLKEKHAEIIYQEDKKVVFAKWSGFLSLNEVESGCSLITKFVKENNIKKHLSDHSNLKVLSRQVQNYLTEIWFFEMADAGLEKLAVKASHDLFAQASVNNVNSKQQYYGLTIQTFRTYDECYEWLESNF